MKFITSLLIFGGSILSGHSINVTENITYGPSMAPTFGPSPFPSQVPTHLPTMIPTSLPTPTPTMGPTPFPSPLPTPSPTVFPSPPPTVFPSIAPTQFPTHDPTPAPTVGPTITPTETPTHPPSPQPSGLPTFKPSRAPTRSPSMVPSPVPSNTVVPTTETPQPTHVPTLEPTAVGGKLFAIYNETISVRVPRVGEDAEYSITGYPNADGIAWGMVAGVKKVFWTDASAGTVSRANFDLTDIEVIMTGLHTPRDISIGVGSPWLFVTGDRKSGIVRASVNGTHKKILATTVAGITGVCHAGPWVYFTTSEQLRLYRMNKDGDQWMSVYDFDASTNDDDGAISGIPMDVTYEPGEGIRPWADDISQESFKEGHVYVILKTQVIRMGIEGAKAKTIISNLTSGYSIDINIANGKIYFSDTDSGVYQANLHGGAEELVFDSTDVRGLGVYTSSVAGTYQPSPAPTKIPTPYPTATRYPSSLPTSIPSPLPTPQPTYIMGTILFSAGEDDASLGPFKYVQATNNYVKMDKRSDANVRNIAIMRNEGEETLVVYTDATLDAVFTVPLTGEASTLPQLLYKGCNDAGAITVPRGSDYIYFACRTYVDDDGLGEREIYRMNKDGSNVTEIASAGSVGPVTSLQTTPNYIYFTTIKGELKLIDYLGSGMKHVVTNLRSPSQLVITRETYIDGYPMMYVATKNAIWKISMDGKDITKLVEGLWDCSGLALDLSHGRMYWTDYDAGGVFSTKLDGSDFLVEFSVKYPNTIYYYTNVVSQITGKPTGAPTRVPTPEPTFTRRPTPSPSFPPTYVPTSAPTYYPGRLYMSADGGLYETMVGSEEGPTQIFADDISDCRGITTTSTPPYVFWIDGTKNEIYRSSMDSTEYTVIYTLTSTDDIYDLAASSTELFVSGSESNSIIKMDLNGSNAEILLTGYPDVHGLDVDADSETIYFASNENNAVYSMSFSGGTVTNVTTDINLPNDVVVDSDQNVLFVICDSVIWLIDLSDTIIQKRLITGFEKATSATMQFGQHRLWIADEDAGIVYQAELTGHDLVERANLTDVKYISFYTSSGAYTNSPSFSPSHGPSEAPSQIPTVSPTTPEPSIVPSPAPSYIPSPAPSQIPTETPSPLPTMTPTVTPSYLFYAVGSDNTNGKIMRATTDGGEIETFVSGGLPQHLAIEQDSKYLYWTDSDAGEIYRTQVGSGGDNGTTDVEVIVSGLTDPTSITVSWEGSDDAGGPHVFWTDKTEKKLYRCNLDGSNAYTMLDDLDGIHGVVATYQYLYFTLKSSNMIYRVDFSCGNADDDCVATQVLIGVCTEPAQLSYSTQTELMYCACQDSIINVKVFKQQGLHDEPMETIIDKFEGSAHNDMVYSFDKEGLYLALYNESALYYMPNVLITDSFDDDDASDDDKAFAGFESELTTIVSVDYIRAVAMYDSGVILDGATLTTHDSVQLRKPERLFATIDDDGIPISDSRVLLSSLELLSQKAPSKSGSVLTPTSKDTTMTKKNDVDTTNVRDLHADFAAAAQHTEEHASPAPAAAAAGVVAVFAAFALASRKKKKRKNGEKGGNKTTSKKSKQVPASFGPRAGYTSIE